MKLINTFCVISALFLFSNVWADNCTIDKKIELAKAGYSKNQIEEMCNKPPECCCVYDRFERMDYVKHYKWMAADKCSRMNEGQSPIFDLDAPHCTDASYCGRSENSEFLPTSIHTSQSSKTSVLAKLFKQAKTQ